MPALSADPAERERAFERFTRRSRTGAASRGCWSRCSTSTTRCDRPRGEVRAARARDAARDSADRRHLLPDAVDRVDVVGPPVSRGGRDGAGLLARNTAYPTRLRWTVLSAADDLFRSAAMQAPPRAGDVEAQPAPGNRWLHADATLQRTRRRRRQGLAVGVQVQGRRRPATGLVYADEVVLTTMRALGREDGLRVRRPRRPGAGRGIRRLGRRRPRWRCCACPASGRRPRRSRRPPPRVGQLAVAIARSWRCSLRMGMGTSPISSANVSTREKTVGVGSGVAHDFADVRVPDTDGEVQARGTAVADPRSRPSHWAPASRCWW